MHSWAQQARPSAPRGCAHGGEGGLHPHAAPSGASWGGAGAAARASRESPEGQSLLAAQQTCAGTGGDAETLPGPPSGDLTLPRPPGLRLWVRDPGKGTITPTAPLPGWPPLPSPPLPGSGCQVPAFSPSPPPPRGPWPESAHRPHPLPPPSPDRLLGPIPQPSTVITAQHRPPPVNNWG